MAYLYLTQHDFDAAERKMREGIRAHNAAHGIVDTLTSGYHETMTMTMAWLHLVAAMLAQDGPPGSAEAFIDAHPQLTQEKMHRRHYSAEVFCSAEAKRTFVPPDLEPLPVVG